MIGKKIFWRNEKGSISFTMETIVSMLIALIVGALLFYFLFVYLYQGNMVSMMDRFKSVFSGAFTGGS